MRMKRLGWVLAWTMGCLWALCAPARAQDAGADGEGTDEAVVGEGDFESGAAVVEGDAHGVGPYSRRESQFHNECHHSG